MDKNEIITLARAIAMRHDLSAEIVLGIIERESSFNCWSIRYEPGFLLRYVAPQYKAGKLNATETYARSFSWGLMQIMGQTAREFGFVGEFLSELSDPEIGIEWGCRKLVGCLRKAEGDMSKALEAYNGGANESYSAEIIRLSGPYRNDA